MINTIVDGICKALNEEFGDTYKIYTEDVEQGLTAPCFLVQRLSNTSELYLGKRYYRTNMIAVNYFPSSTEPSSECADVSDRLFTCLEVISTGTNDYVRGNQMEVTLSDDVLVFTISYSYFVDQTVTYPYMEEIDINGGVKDDG